MSRPPRTSLKPKRDRLVDRVKNIKDLNDNKLDVTTRILHAHTCPLCGLVYNCCLNTPEWDQEDTNCRWWEEVVCHTCLRKKERKS